MKKFFRIFFRTLLILILLILLVLFTAPALFKKQIIARVEQVANEKVNARVEIGDFRLSFFRNFPNLNVGLKDLYVSGHGSFEGDTLAGFQSFQLVFDLSSLLGKEGYKVRSVILDRPVIQGRVLADGSPNWDIMLPDTAAVEEIAAEEEVSTEESGELPGIKVQLKEFKIVNGRVSFIDEAADMRASMADLNYSLSGDLSASQTDLKMITDIKGIEFSMGGMRYLHKAVFTTDLTLGADMENQVFTFKDNRIGLNALQLGFDGTVAMKGDRIETDLTFETLETTFRSLLSMVPAVFLQDFDGLETSGSLALNGYAKGAYVATDSLFPDIGLTLTVKDGMFKYPDLPKSVTDVNIETKVQVVGDDLDKTTVDLSRFELKLGDNPFKAGMHVSTPISDPTVKGYLDGQIDLSTLADAVPMDSLDISGRIETDVRVEGSMSMYEEERYDDFILDGLVHLEAIEVEMAGMPGILLHQADLTFSPREVMLKDFEVQAGESDFLLNGSLREFVPFALRGETVVGRLELLSQNINVNEFMPEADTSLVEETEEADSLVLSVIQIPRNIDMRFTSELKHILYDNIEIDNLMGIIAVKDGTLALEGLDLYVLNGSVHMDALYDSRDSLKPAVEANFKAADIGIKEAFETFNTIQKIAPAAKGFGGDVTLSMRYNSLLGADMMPVLESIEARGKLQSEEVQVLESKTFEKMSSLLKLSDNYSNTFKDLDITFDIHEGRIYVEPFTTKLGNIAMTVSGDQGLDQTLNYKIKTKVPRKALGDAANSLINSLSAQASLLGLNYTPGEYLEVNMGITGTSANPQVSMLGMGQSGEASSSVKEQAKEKIVEEVTKVKEDVKEQAQEKVNEQADKLMAEAEKEAKNIRQKAAEAAEALRGEANLQAKKLEEEAAGKNRLAQIAAKKVADGVRKKGEDAAKKVEAEADEKAEAVLAAARKKVEELKKK